MTEEKREAALMTSSLRRAVKMGGLVGRVGGSILGTRVLEVVRSKSGQDARRAENLVRNATRVVETLGEMRGAAMKIGQMLSLQEGLLPPEVSLVLQSLQKEAPAVPPEVMRYELEGSLGAPVDRLFAEFDEQAFAAASIGQVHRAVLHDGRDVAVKVQYPLIREVVTADLANFKRLLMSLFSLVFDGGFEPLWEEVRDRLLEELDYRHEAANLSRMRELHRAVPEVVIPDLVPELSSDRVLTMEFVEGLSSDRVFSSEVPQELRDRWGQVLFSFLFRGLFRHRLLHADPNLANFAFREDGAMVVYDFGSLKVVPESVARAYAELLRLALEARWEAVPDALAALGLVRSDGRALDAGPLAVYFDLVGDILRRDPHYRFGADDEVLDRVLTSGLENWNEATDVRFPRDVIFVQRSLSGHFGNLGRLRAAGPWREIVQRELGDLG